MIRIVLVQMTWNRQFGVRETLRTSIAYITALLAAQYIGSSISETLKAMQSMLLSEQASCLTGSPAVLVTATLGYICMVLCNDDKPSHSSYPFPFLPLLLMFQQLHTMNYMLVFSFMHAFQTLGQSGAYSNCASGDLHIPL